MGRNRDWHRKIAIMVKGGCSPIQIADILKDTTEDEVRSSILIHQKDTLWYVNTMFEGKAYLGHKTESCLDENIMLNGYPDYSYKELTKDEKSIYNNKPWVNK